MIHLEGVSKVYPGGAGPVRALDDLSLSVEKGEFVAVRGPSGSGKSTLLTLIGGLHTPTSGKVIVAGQELQAMDAAQRTRFRASTMGFVFQMFHLVPYLSVRENVLLPAIRRNGKDPRQRAQQLLDKLDLSDRLKHRPEELSTGERQRVAIARALINEPELILADEPTGNLDPDNASIVMDYLAEFQSSGGTILLVTHEEVAASRAQRTVHLRAGRIDATKSEGPGS